MLLVAASSVVVVAVWSSESSSEEAAVVVLARAVVTPVVATATLEVEDGYCLSRAHQVSRSPTEVAISEEGSVSWYEGVEEWPGTLGRELEDGKVLTLAGIIGAVVVAGNDVGILCALAAVVLTAAQGELAVLGTQAGLDNVSGGAGGGRGGLGRSDGEHGGEGKKSGLHFDGLGIIELGLVIYEDVTTTRTRTRSEKERNTAEE